MKCIKAWWCNLMHLGNIVRDNHGRINWQCSTCGRYAMPVSLEQERRMTDRAIASFMKHKAKESSMPPHETYTTFVLPEDEANPEITLLVYGYVSSGGSYAHDSVEPPWTDVEITDFFLDSEGDEHFLPNIEITPASHPKIFARLTPDIRDSIREALAQSKDD